MVILPSVSRGGSAAPRDSASNVMRENTKHMQQCCSHILPTFLQNFLYLLLFLWTYVFSGSVTHSHTDPTGPIQDFRVLLRSLRASDAHFQVHHNSTSVFCEPTAYMMCQPQPHVAQKKIQVTEKIEHYANSLTSHHNDRKVGIWRHLYQVARVQGFTGHMLATCERGQVDCKFSRQSLFGWLAWFWRFDIYSLAK